MNNKRIEEYINHVLVWKPHYILEVLRESRRLLKVGWCQNLYAANINGDAVNITNPTACKFCASGAPAYVIGDSRPLDNIHYNVIVGLLSHTIPKKYRYIQSWNDRAETTLEDVISIYDQVIEAVESHIQERY